MGNNKKFKNHHNNRPTYVPTGSEQALATSVSELGLNETTLDILTKGNLLTVRDIAVRTERDMFKIQGLGKKHLFEIKGAIAKLSVDFRPMPVVTEDNAKNVTDNKKKPDETSATSDATVGKSGSCKDKSQKHYDEGKNPPDKSKQNCKKNFQENVNRNDKKHPEKNAAKRQNSEAVIDANQNNISIQSDNKNRKEKKRQQNPYNEDTEAIVAVQESLEKFFHNEKFVAGAPKEYKEDRFKKFSKAGKFGFIDRATNKEVIPPIYDEACNFKEDYACVEKNSLFGYINRQNDLVIPYKYDCALSFSEGLACVTLNDKSGYINKQGETVLDFIYEAATSFEEGAARVRVNGRWALIDKQGAIRFL